LISQESDGDDWSEDRDSLWNVLMYGVELCCREGSLPPEAMRTYFASGMLSFGGLYCQKART